jgi:16S rRNA (cytosine967-C5)-methyltransferase
MVKRWIELYGVDAAIKILKANNERPFTTFRINKLKADLGEILAYLRANGIEFSTSPYSEESITIKTRGIDLFALNMFREGKVSIQDTSASLATKLANAKPGDKILDMCAAPGGKSFCLAEQINNNGSIIALDKYPSKLRFIKEGSERLGITCISAKEADSTNLNFEEKFDIVFLDAPCSGLGTLSKKPDIRWKREREDVPVLVNTQRELLENALAQVKVGGVLVYSTCTIEPDENECNIEWFLNKHPEFELDRAENYLHKDVCKDGFMMTFQHIHKCDGAFAARLIKKSESVISPSVVAD